MNLLFRYLLLLFVVLSQKAYAQEVVKTDDSLVLYLFLLDECVISTQYTATMRDLHNRFGSKVEFVGIFPNFASKKEAIEDWQKTYNIPFETRTDYYKTLCKKLGATVTPEVVLYNESSQEKLYQGRIDNLYAGLGRRRRQATQHDLADALHKATQGLPMTFKKTEAIGCFINYNDLTK